MYLLSTTMRSCLQIFLLTITLMTVNSADNVVNKGKNVPTFVTYETELQENITDLPVKSERIVGGNSVNIQDHPYQVSVRVEGRHSCGGSIISSVWAVTAAHCSRTSLTSLSIRAGSSYHKSGGSLHAVAQKVIHPQYNPTTFDYDIAVLRVNRPFLENGVANLIALPRQNAVVPGGTMATVSGWGTQSSGSMSIPSVLQATTVPVFTHASCKSVYRFTSISARMLCAGQQGRDSCQGDSGGPLVAILGDGIKQLIGVVSWGLSCGKGRFPGVYANVPVLRTWIKTTTNV